MISHKNSNAIRKKSNWQEAVNNTTILEEWIHELDKQTNGKVTNKNYIDYLY